VKALKAFQKRNYLCTIGEAMQAAGLSRAPWYDWQQDEQFRQWWLAESVNGVLKV
jgi:hypothetical protein